MTDRSEKLSARRDRDARRDVAIVGGSAAGFFMACRLAKHGVPVRVIEAAETIDPLPRTLVVTHGVLDLLGGVGQRAVVNAIRRFELFTDGRVATVALRHPDLVVERATLIAELAREAQNAGAEVLFGRKFVGLSPNGSGLRLLVEHSRRRTAEELHAATVVGADGAFSAVARSAGWPSQATVPLVQATVELPADLEADTVRVWFVPDDTPYFFWLIPHSPRFGVLGLIGEEGRQTRNALERFLEKRSLKPVDFQAARVPLYTRWVAPMRRVGGADVYLVGDAGGHVKVTTVGGLGTGFRAADAIASAIVKGDATVEFRSLRRELDVHLFVRKVLHDFTQADYSRLLDLLNGHARRALGSITRDQASRLLLALSFSQPRFLLMALRGLLAARRFPQRLPR